jgi:RNA polymerase sigma-70 factor (sigma-E family)
VGIRTVTEPGEDIDREPSMPGPEAPAGRPSSGWSESFVELYREHYLPMVRLAYLLVGSNSVAEEIVQDVFVRVRLAIDRADNPRAYLRGAVVNGCRNQRRRESVERRYQRYGPLAGAAPQDELRDALAKLPDRQRAVLVLRYYEGMSEAEIAEVLDCRRGTVKSAAARGLAALRQVIEQ